MMMDAVMRKVLGKSIGVVPVKEKETENDSNKVSNMCGVAKNKE